MKLLKNLLVLMFAVVGLIACSAEYDNFDQSHYKALKNISFKEQDGESAIYEAEHIVKVTTVAPKNGKETWDSLTLEDVNLSNRATLHLVKGKFKEFPEDSSSLESLAWDVSYDANALHVGDRIRIPQSLKVYLMVVAENGDPAIWQMQVTVPGVKAESSSSSDDSGEGDSSESSSSEEKSGGEDSASSSSSVDKTTSSSSSSVVLSDNNDFKISFKSELENKVSGDTVFVTFAQGTDLSKVELDTAIIHRSAKIDVEPSSIKDWSKAQTFKITAESGKERTWVVVVSAVLSSATDLKLQFKELLKVKSSGDTISIWLKSDQSVDKAVVESFKVSDGAIISPVPSDVKEWKSSQTFEVTAEDGTKRTWVLLMDVAAADEKASDEKELLSISAEGEIAKAEVNASEKTVLLHLASQEALAAVSVTVAVSATASQDLQGGALDLRTPVKMTITAEDASTVEWTISADFPKSSEADVKTFTLDGITPSEAPAIESSKHAISFEVPYGTDLSKVYFNATYSDKATKTSPAEDYLDLTSKSAKISVTAQDGSVVEWTVNVTVAEPPVVKVAPRIRSMKIAGNDAIVDSVEESGKKVFWIHYDNLTFLADLTDLAVSGIELSEGATIDGVTDGSSYDLSYGKKVTVTNGDESLDYEIRAGYQYPNSNFDSWSGNKPGNWDNGNQTGIVSVTITSSTSSGSGKAVYMQTKKAPVVKTLASGNLFIGVMNPKGVAATSMLDYKDGNELIDFGKPFAARPRYMELDIQYDGKTDSCDVYLLLENRASTKTCTNGSSAGSNVCRTSSDVNTLVASAWYRATSDSSNKNPDVVSISKPDATTKLRTLRMKLKYGEPYAASPIMNVGSTTGKVSTLYDGGLVNTKGIDNHLVVGDGSLPVTHIRAVFAASADGNHYSGVEGAVFVVDNFRLIY